MPFIDRPGAMSSSLSLVEPHRALAASYRSLVAEVVARGEPMIPFVLGFPHEDFDALIGTLAACARGEGLAREWVAHSTFWLVRDASEVVGVSNLRHALTPALRREGGNIGYGVRPSARRQGLATNLLRLTLVRARSIGHTEVLLTCAKTNLGSVAAILRNGGVLASEEFLPERNEVVQRYRIELVDVGSS